MMTETDVGVIGVQAKKNEGFLPVVRQQGSRHRIFSLSELPQGTNLDNTLISDFLFTDCKSIMLF